MNATELFFSTIQSGKIENIRLQLEHNPDLVNTRDARGFTPLIFATYLGQGAITKLLVEQGARIDDKDASGNTALMGVCFKGHTEMINYLIDHGADVNKSNTSGVTPLIFSSIYNQANSVRLLIRHNADVSITDENGKTALDHAVEKQHQSIIEILKKTTL